MATRIYSIDEPIRLCPFTIVCDTREQAVYKFTAIDDGENPLVVQTEVATLHTGDYSIKGFEKRITLERKSLADFYGSIGGGHEREEAKASRMVTYEYAAYVIEADLREVFDCRDTKVLPASVRGTITAWAIRYGVHFWFMPGRRNAEVWTFRLLDMFWRTEQAKQKELTKVLAAI